MCYINKCTPYKSAIIANLKGVFLVEARRIELQMKHFIKQILMEYPIFKPFYPNFQYR